MKDLLAGARELLIELGFRAILAGAAWWIISKL
jgi:hypothetical protein